MPLRIVFVLEKIIGLSVALLISVVMIDETNWTVSCTIPCT